MLTGGGAAKQAEVIVQDDPSWLDATADHAPFRLLEQFGKIKSHASSVMAVHGAVPTTYNVLIASINSVFRVEPSRKARDFVLLDWNSVAAFRLVSSFGVKYELLV